LDTDQTVRIHNNERIEDSVLTLSHGIYNSWWRNLQQKKIKQREEICSKKKLSKENIW